MMRDNTLLVVVAGSVVNSGGWRVASDEGQYAASCCHGQHCQLGWLGSCQVMRDNTLLLVVAGSVVDSDDELQVMRDNSDGELQATRGNTLGINR